MVQAGRYSTGVLKSRHLRGLAIGGLGLLLVACQREPTCALPSGHSHPLNLSQASDRAHFESDRREADRAAFEYGNWAAAHPPADSSRIDIETLRQHAKNYCRELLSDSIASAHHVTER
jgi:hypothetical protein